ncbi:hypothetical protein C8R45DRAFT_947635 [Mycena sanguinolenta]|nr:hypothetical protein C8R45DRAFT_947635 [Mycena sanguinolenta]
MTTSTSKHRKNTAPWTLWNVEQDKQIRNANRQVEFRQRCIVCTSIVNFTNPPSSNLEATLCAKEPKHRRRAYKRWRPIVPSQMQNIVKGKESVNICPGYFLKASGFKGENKHDACGRSSWWLVDRVGVFTTKDHASLFVLTTRPRDLTQHFVLADARDEWADLCAQKHDHDEDEIVPESDDDRSVHGSDELEDVAAPDVDNNNGDRTVDDNRPGSDSDASLTHH